MQRAGTVGHLNRSTNLVVRLRPSERALLNRAAAAAGERISTWAREMALRAARRKLRSAHAGP